MKLMYRIYFLLMTVMFCWSCKKDVPEDVGADTLILGKWEFVRNSYISAGEIFVEKHIPGGYVEFLPEGRFAWYDYQTKIYTLFEVRYFLINQYWMYDDWILQNTNQAEYSHQKTAIGNPFGLPSLYNNIISFENKNTMMLHNHEKSIPYYIYSRIK